MYIYIYVWKYKGFSGAKITFVETVWYRCSGSSPTSKKPCMNPRLSIFGEFVKSGLQLVSVFVAYIELSVVFGDC